MSPFDPLLTRSAADIINLSGGRDRLARYILHANGAAGPIEFQERLTIEVALVKAQELRDAHFTHISIVNVLTGLEITDVEALLAIHENAAGDGT